MNNKVFGTKSDFAYVRNDGSRIVLGYGLAPVDNDSEHYEWREVYLPKKQHPIVTAEDAKKAIIADIDARTDERILSGYVWQGKPVWLSMESQHNFQEAHRLQIIPVKFKIGEDADGQPVYHTFETFDELDEFYKGGVNYINQCLNEGWVEKDIIDFSPYEDALPTGGTADGDTPVEANE